MRWWPWRRREPDLPPEDERNGSVSEIKRDAQMAHQRAQRERWRVERMAPRIADLPEEEFVSRVAELFKPRPTT